MRNHKRGADHREQKAGASRATRLLVPSGAQQSVCFGRFAQRLGFTVRPLRFCSAGKKFPRGYWKMSVNIAEAFGMKIDFWDSDFRVVKQQKPKGDDYHAEIDMSSAFALAAIAAVSGQATFLDFPEE